MNIKSIIPGLSKEVGEIIEGEGIPFVDEITPQRGELFARREAAGRSITGSLSAFRYCDLDQEVLLEHTEPPAVVPRMGEVALAQAAA